MLPFLAWAFFWDLKVSRSLIWWRTVRPERLRDRARRFLIRVRKRGLSELLLGALPILGDLPPCEVLVASRGMHMGPANIW